MSEVKESERALLRRWNPRVLLFGKSRKQHTALLIAIARQGDAKAIAALRRVATKSDSEESRGEAVGALQKLAKKGNHDALLALAAIASKTTPADSQKAALSKLKGLAKEMSIGSYIQLVRIATTGAGKPSKSAMLTLNLLSAARHAKLITESLAAATPENDIKDQSLVTLISLTTERSTRAKLLTAILTQRPYLMDELANAILHVENVEKSEREILTLLSEAAKTPVTREAFMNTLVARFENGNEEAARRLYIYVTEHSTDAIEAVNKCSRNAWVRGADREQAALASLATFGLEEAFERLLTPPNSASSLLTALKTIKASPASESVKRLQLGDVSTAMDSLENLTDELSLRELLFAMAGQGDSSSRMSVLKLAIQGDRDALNLACSWLDPAGPAELSETSEQLLQLEREGLASVVDPSPEFKVLGSRMALTGPRGWELHAIRWAIAGSDEERETARIVASRLELDDRNKLAFSLLEWVKEGLDLSRLIPVMPPEVHEAFFMEGSAIWANETHTVELAVALQGTGLCNEPDLDSELRLFLDPERLAVEAGASEVRSLVVTRTNGPERQPGQLSDLQNLADSVLRRLERLDAREELCRLAVRDDSARSDLCMSIAIDAEYTPSLPRDQVLFFLFSTQVDELELIDPGTSILGQIWASEPSQRERIARVLRREGRSDLLLRATEASSEHTLDSKEVLEIASDLLNDGFRDQVFQLSQLCDPTSGMALIGSLGATDWMPVDQADASLFEELLSLCSDLGSMEDVIVAPQGESGAMAGLRTKLQIASAGITAVGFTPDGGHLLLGDRGGSLAMVDLSSASVTWKRSNLGRVVSLACLDERSALVASRGGDVLGLLLADDYQWTSDLDSKCTVVASLGDQGFLSGHRDGTIRHWSLDGRELQRTDFGNRGSIRSLSVSPGGEWVAAGTTGIHAFRTARQKSSYSYGQASDVLCIVISDEGTLFTADSAGDVRALLHQGGRLVRRSGNVADLQDEPIELCMLDAFRTLVVVEHHALCLLDVSGDESVLVHRAEIPAGATSAVPSPRRTRLAVGTESGDLLLWDVVSVEHWRSTNKYLAEPMKDRGPDELPEIADLGHVMPAQQSRALRFLGAVLNSRYANQFRFHTPQPMADGEFQISLSAD